MAESHGEALVAKGSDGVATGIGHIGLTVRNRERSLGFYRDLIGLTEVDCNEFAEPSFGELTNNPGARIRTALLDAGSFLLQLIEYVDGGGETLGLDHRHVGNLHFCFYVEDADRAFKEVTRRGFEVTSGIVGITDKIRSFYVADPDGVAVELMEGTYP